MNEYYNTIRLALILAKQAEIEGMKVDNLIREQEGKSLAYSGDDFEQKADELRNIAYCHNQQL